MGQGLMYLWSSFTRWFYTKAGVGALAQARRLRERGEYARAAVEFERAERALSRGGLPQSHSWIKQAIANRAWCKVKVGEFDTAIRLYQQVLDVEAIAGETDYAQTLREQLRWAEGEAVHGTGHPKA